MFRESLARLLQTETGFEVVAMESLCVAEARLRGLHQALEFMVFIRPRMVTVLFIKIQLDKCLGHFLGGENEIPSGFRPPKIPSREIVHDFPHIGLHSGTLLGRGWSSRSPPAQ